MGVRALFFAIDAALGAMIILSLIRGEVWWQLYFQAVLWPWLTYQTGWLVPATVDNWRSDQVPSGASDGSGGSSGS